MTPRKHKHAEMIHAWADGEDIQYFDDYANERILIGESHVWCDDNEYRIKPKMIRCGDLEFPEPMRVAPENGTEYWTAETSTSGPYIDKWMWVNDSQDQCCLGIGICHTTQAAAEQHARALIALTEAKGE